MTDLMGSVDADEAVNNYARMLSKYVSKEGLPTVQAGTPESWDKDAFTTRFDSVLLYLVPGAKTCDVMFMGRTKEGLNLRFTETMELASSERMEFIERMLKQTISKYSDKRIIWG